MSGRRFVPRRSGMLKRRVDLAPRLESLETRQLLTVYTVMSSADSGGSVGGKDLTLRAAIGLARGGDEIDFAIPGSGVHTIALRTPLPAISVPITIDGSTQGGGSSSGQPLIEINGSNISGSAIGLQLQGDGTTIRKLIIDQFNGAGIDVTGDKMTIQGCFIGVDPSGTTAGANLGNGITLEDGSSSNIIGGSQAGQSNVISGNFAGISLSSNNSRNVIAGNLIGTDYSGTAAIPNLFDGISVLGGRFNTIGGSLGPQGGSATGGINPAGNVISGNSGNGILFLGSTATSNFVAGNLIGTSADGLSAVANSGDGIGFVGAPSNIIGGTLKGDLNVISGNTGNGLSFTGGNFNAIVGNYIGTDITGAVALGNQGAGVADNGGSSVTIGGTAAGAGNVIAFNGNSTNSAADDGIYIFSGTKISIEGNSIYANVGLGINLWDIDDDPDSVTPNDTKDTDTGTNNLQNYPTLSFAATGASVGGSGAANQTIVRGSLNSAPRSTFLLEFFANPSDELDPSGYGEGKIFLGRTSVTTDANGDAPINITLATGTVPGYSLTATATDSSGNTSEFSPTQLVSQAPSTELQLVGDAAPDPVTVNGTLTYTLTVTNNGPDDADNVVVTDTLPSGIKPNPDVIADQGTVSIANGVVTVSVGSLLKGQSSTITISVVPLAAGTVANTATVTSDGIDPDLSDNTVNSSVTVTIPADVSVTETIETADGRTDGINNGQTFVYVLTVTKRGAGHGDRGRAERNSSLERHLRRVQLPPGDHRSVPATPSGRTSAPSIPTAW